MSHIKTQSLFRVGKIVGAALFFFCGAQQAAAIPSGPLGCGGVFGVGGCPPYRQVIFATGTPGSLFSGSLFEYDNVVLDYSVTGASAAVRGAVDLANGKLKVVAVGIEDGNPSTGVGGSIIASGTDVFTLHGTSASGSVTFSVVLTADGAGTITNDGYSGRATVSLGVPGGGGGGFDFGLYQAGDLAGGFPIPGVQFALLSTMPGRQGNQLRASDTYSLPLNIPFDLNYSLRADVSQGTTFDLFNTGHLSFILPAGVTITSMGGFSAGGITTPVPEPSTWLLLGAGLLGLGTITRRRRA